MTGWRWWLHCPAAYLFGAELLGLAVGVPIHLLTR